jgi:NAD(P)-dependent dehydrogenase (short-subunit alcohol dehydrogenase family)
VLPPPHSGLGYEAAKSLAAHNPHRLILAVRNTKAGETAAQEIVRSNGGKVVPEVWFLDLGDMKTVKAFAERAGRELDRLDVVVSDEAGKRFPIAIRIIDSRLSFC